MFTKQNISIALLATAVALAGFYFFTRNTPEDNGRTAAEQAGGATEVKPGQTVPVVPGQQLKLNTEGGQQSISPTNTQTQPPAQTVQPTDPATFTKVEFKNPVFNFGTIKEGDKVKHTFKFKNTGDKPLTITNAQASCGCTTPNWTREPVAPGGTGEIEAVFDSKHKVGPQEKFITVTANIPEPVKLTLKGEVIENPNARSGIRNE